METSSVIPKQTKPTTALRQKIQEYLDSLASGSALVTASQYQEAVRGLRSAMQELLQNLDTAEADTAAAWQALDSELKRSNEILGSAPGGFLKTDGEGFICKVDHNAAVLLHSAERKLLKKALISLVAPEYQEEYHRRIEQAKQSRRIQEWVSGLLLPGGVAIPVAFTLTFDPEAAGEPGELGWLVRNISQAQAWLQLVDQKRVELELRVRERASEMLVANERLKVEEDKRKRVEESLTRAREGMEIKVRERTEALAAANEKLRIELRERLKAEAAAARRERQLDAIHSATMVVLSTLDLETLLGQILDAVTVAIPKAQKGVLYLIARDTGQLEMRASIGYSDPRIQRISMPGGKGYIAIAVKDGKPVLVSDIKPNSTIRYAEGKLPEMELIQSAIAAPLVSENEVLGALALESTERKAFTKEDLDLLVTFAATATATIHNAMLHAEVQKLAITDALTAIYNRRGFFELGRHEFERARRFGRQLCALMIDLDEFKKVNDQFGHPAGDQVLRVVADRIHSCVRGVDILARYGGDEFILLVTETGLVGGEEVAGRIRDSVCAEEITLETASVYASVSIGVTELSPEMQNLEELINLADVALYASKQGGRNQVSCIPANPNPAV